MYRGRGGWGVSVATCVCWGGGGVDVLFLKILLNFTTGIFSFNAYKFLKYLKSF